VPKEHKEPATANEFTSIPIKFNNSSPQKENNHNNTSYDRPFSDSICPCFDLKSTIIGIVPTISITAKAIQL
jgi:hypothetical protein